MDSPDKLLSAALAGDRPALARLLSLAERGTANLLEIEQGISRHVGNAFVVGITGAPGAGKSTLINSLLPVAQAAMQRAAVLAVDPSSPFSRGALLGDRVRMQGRNFGAGVFIRSMASRGELGGLAQSASTCVRLFDACGWPLVIVETLGIGQVELDIMDLADTVVIVLNPGWGDAIQANKAGITEAGDVFVINKADKPGANETRKDLLDSLSLLRREPKPAVVETVATTGSGVPELWHAIEAQRARVSMDGELQRRRAARQHRLIAKVLRRQIEQHIDTVMDSDLAASLLADASLGEIDLEKSVKVLLKALADA